jgi:hypothetical protein
MDVYLIPLGPDRYELYCEDGGDLAEMADDLPSGFLSGLVHRFRAWLSRVEQEHRESARVQASGGASRSWTRRLRDRVVRWTAERIAEQRLLWHLLRQSDACAVFPDDLPDSRAMTTVRRVLQRDADRHRRWAFVHAVALVLAGLVAVLPGPNLIAYYFAFRLAGHYFSMRGARHGLSRVTWSLRPSRPLAELRAAIALAAPERERAVGAVAATLRLPHLAGFLKRTTVSGA